MDLTAVKNQDLNEQVGTGQSSANSVIENFQVDIRSDGLPLEQAREYIQHAEFTAVVERLVRVDGWSRKSATLALEQYRNFLFLKKKYGSQYVLPPSREIDEVWHAHVLHTKDYFNFCNIVFGEYLHHTPHLVGEANESRSALEEMFTNTQELYKAEFGDYLYTIKMTLFRDRLVRVLLASLKLFLPLTVFRKVNSI